MGQYKIHVISMVEKWFKKISKTLILVAACQRVMVTVFYSYSCVNFQVSQEISHTAVSGETLDSVQTI